MKSLINRRIKNLTSYVVKRNYKKSSVLSKNLTFLRTQRFLETYPILFFFQHNNLSVSQWKKLKTIKNCEFLVVKNSVLRHLIGLTSDIKHISSKYDRNMKKVKTQLIHEKNEMNGKATPTINEYSTNLFQGPCFILGIKDSSQLKILKNLQNQKLPIFFVGGLVNNHILNHLDIEKWVQLDINTYTPFVSSLNQSFLLVNTFSVNSLLYINTLRSSLVNALEFLKIKLKETPL